MSISVSLTVYGFIEIYDAPSKMKAEAAVEIAVDDGEEILRGRIDALILQQNFWVLVLEAKKKTISTRSALPQALAYMMANTQANRPTFGMMTNGDDVLFVKLTTQPSGQYGLSRVFSLYTLPEELQSVLQMRFWPLAIASVVALIALR
jgi:type I site-specific restriction endonuclease